MLAIAMPSPPFNITSDILHTCHVVVYMPRGHHSTVVARFLVLIGACRTYLFNLFVRGRLCEQHPHVLDSAYAPCAPIALLQHLGIAAIYVKELMLSMV